MPSPLHVLDLGPPRVRCACGRDVDEDILGAISPPHPQHLEGGAGRRDASQLLQCLLLPGGARGACGHPRPKPTLVAGAASVPRVCSTASRTAAVPRRRLLRAAHAAPAATAVAPSAARRRPEPVGDFVGSAARSVSSNSPASISTSPTPSSRPNTTGRGSSTLGYSPVQMTPFDATSS